MLHRELPRIDSTPLDGGDRWLVPALLAAAGVSTAIILLLLGLPLWSAALPVVACGAAAVLMRPKTGAIWVDDSLSAGPDYALVGSALSLSRDPVALTDGEGSLLVANDAYREAFGNAAPLTLGSNEDAGRGLALAHGMAWRDGAGCVTGIETQAGSRPVGVERAGPGKDVLIWHFPGTAAPDTLSVAVRRVEGEIGERFAAAGVASAVVDPTGAILAANSLFVERAIPPGESIREKSFGVHSQ